MIKNLLFDFGGVFLNLDKQATQSELNRYFPKGLPVVIQQLHHQYEKGEISSEKFINTHLDYTKDLKQQDFIHIWNSILGRLPEHRLKFLEELKASGKFRLFLLSNTNELHINWVKGNNENFNRFQSCFEQFYLSHEIGYRKPSTEIFEFVISQNHIKPGETLFIDDTIDHIQTAKKLGFQVWHLKEKEQDVTDLFEVKRSIL